MASKRNANRAYINSLIAEVSAIPPQVVKQVAHFLYFKILQLSTDEGGAGFDSGQAAANWRMVPYTGPTPAAGAQEMMWGYEGVSPTHPVGYKGGGNPDLVFSVMMEYGAAQLATAPTNISGVLVYNSIKPGHPEFAPGDDQRYEENALYKHHAKQAEMEAWAAAQGEAASRRMIRGIK